MVLIIFNSIFLLCESWQHFSLLIAPFQLLKAKQQTNKQKLQGIPTAKPLQDTKHSL